MKRVFLTFSKDKTRKLTTTKSNNSLLIDSIKLKNLFIERKINNKFHFDKVFEYDNDIFVSIDGIILNSTELKLKNASSSIFTLIKKLYNSYKDDFIKQLRGDFSLVLYDLKKNTLLIYTNITSTKPIYYYYNHISKDLYASSNPMYLVDRLKKNSIKLTPNINAFYISAAYGYLFGEDNYTNEIKKLEPGKYIKVNLSELKIETYFKLQSFPLKVITMKQAIDQLEERFIYAVDLQFKKDLEYNYKHLSTLSGGLDSRMTTIVAHSLGYNSDTITFSSKGYWDYIIAKQISNFFNLENISYIIENGEYLKEYNKLMKIDGGVVSFHSAAQMIPLYQKINFKNYGQIHTGQIGDAIIGNTINPKNTHYKYGEILPRYVKEYKNRIEPIIIEELHKHETLEETKFYNHVFNGTSKGNWVIHEFTESSSPFTFQDVMSFCFQLPYEIRNNHKLYFSWIKKYHKSAGMFFYEKTKRRTLKYSNNRYLNKINHLINLFELKLIGLKTKDNQLLNFDRWNNDDELMNYFNKVFNNNIEFISDPQLRDSIYKQYHNSNFLVKMQAFNVVLVYNEYFSLK